MKIMSWNDRLALIAHYNPADDAVCTAFNVTNDELATARNLHANGQFTINAQFDVTKYGNVFAAPSAIPTPTAKATGVTSATTHTKPETATKTPKQPQKRGRKGAKIYQALQAVTTTPVAVDSFMKQHDVSLAVLRQSKRFIAKMDSSAASAIGKINVRQDKKSKQLMIWREV